MDEGRAPTIAGGRGRLPPARTVLRQALHPPLHDPAFWAIQVAVLGLAGLHLYLDVAGALESAAFPTGSPVALLLLPVLYSALRYGLAGSAATALWATLLWLPDLLLPDLSGHPAADLLDLIIVDAVSILVGIHVERGFAQRDRLAAAERDRHDYALRLLAAQEDERRHLAHEIHDDPLQRLIHLARTMDTMAGPSAGPAVSVPALQAGRAELIDVIGRLRDVARGLRPPGLDQLGLVAAVRGLLADVEDGGGARLDLEVGGAETRLDPDLELGAFRIVQEAISNVTRHAAARSATVRLGYDDAWLRVRVADDGRGFVGAPPGGDHHLGLAGMHERATLLGGSLEVSSTPGRGTVVEAWLPLAPSAAAVP